jgi:CheY-like chemotaxis protein
MMDGDITLESVYGEGSTFTLRIPRYPHTDGLFVKPGVETPPVDLELPEGAATVLVIDDDIAVREYVDHYLSNEGFNIALASGGQEGLEKARELKPDVITLDILMPDIDGWSVLSALKSDPELRDIPVVVMSMVEDRSTGVKLGAAEYLSKPVDPKRLTSIINKYKNGGSSVLLLEDDENARALMRRVLERDGWSVTDSANGEEGLLALDSGIPEIIVLDLLMPKMDGFQFLSAIEDREDMADVPIIVVTAKDLTERDKSQLTDQVKRVLEKGQYSRDQLLDEVRVLIADSIAEA